MVEGHHVPHEPQVYLDGATVWKIRSGLPRVDGRGSRHSVSERGFEQGLYPPHVRTDAIKRGAFGYRVLHTVFDFLSQYH